MLNNELHFLLLKAFNHSNNLIIQQVYDLDLLPGQPKILEYLLEHDGTIAKNISRDHVLDKSTITSLLSRMEKQNLIVRKNQINDKRAYSLHLTEKGKESAQKVKQICGHVDDIAFKNISSEDKQQFLQILNIIIKNLREESLR